MKICKTKEEKEIALSILENAFANSKGVTWVINNNKSKIRILLKTLLEEAALKNGAYLTQNKEGAVLFYQLENNNSSLILTIKKAYVFLFVVGIKNGLKVIRYKNLINKTRPKHGWLGWLVATNHTSKGRVAAFEIKNEMFRIADENNAPIFVETTVERVRKLYLAAGYHEYGSIPHPYENLTIWFLKRNPTIKETK